MAANPCKIEININQISHWFCNKFKKYSSVVATQTVKMFPMYEKTISGFALTFAKKYTSVGPPKKPEIITNKLTLNTKRLISPFPVCPKTLVVNTIIKKLMMCETTLFPSVCIINLNKTN